VISSLEEECCACLSMTLFLFLSFLGTRHWISFGSYLNVLGPIYMPQNVLGNSQRGELTAAGGVNGLQMLSTPASTVELTHGTAHDIVLHAVHTYA
jgi:hypothetical protein